MEAHFMVQCPHCRQIVTVHGVHVGMVVACPRCRQQMTVPPPVAEPVVEEPVFRSEPRYKAANRSGGLVAAAIIGAVAVSVVSVTLVVWSNREPAKGTAQATAVAPPAKAPPRVDPPIVSKPKPPVKVDREPFFDEAVMSLKGIASEMLVEGEKEFVEKAKLFSEEEKLAVRRITGHDGRLRAVDASLLSRLNLRRIRAARILASTLENKQAVDVANIVWDRSPKSRSVDFLGAFLERFWEGDEGFFGAMDDVSRQGAMGDVERLQKFGREGVGEEAFQRVFRSTRYLKLFFEGRLGGLKNLSRDEKDALIRFAGEEAVLNSP